MSIRVYKYGLLKPIENASLVDDQISAAHQYRNALIEIERERRDAVRTLTRNSDVNIVTLEEKLATAKKTEENIAREIKLQHSQMRSRMSTQTDKEDLKAARLKTKEIKVALRQARYEAKNSQVIIDETDLINERFNERVRGARASSNLYWGTYLIVEDAMKAAQKAPLYDGDKPNNPKFMRWTGEGTVAVQLQGGLNTEDVFREKNTLVRIDPIDEKAFNAEKRSERRKASRTVLHLRIQSDDSKKPVWASWPMVMHRPLPDNSTIKWAKVHRRMRGPREEWYVCFEVDTSAKPQVSAAGAVAIDIGWRHMKDSSGESAGFRIAKWRDEDANIGEVKIDPHLLGALKKANELRSVRDDNFNLARAKLIDWMKECPVSPWLEEQTKTIAQWRSIARFAALTRCWASNRFSGDEVIYGAMEKWRYHDYHLWAWESSQRIKAIRHRRETYRVLAAELSQKYSILVLEDFDLTELSQKTEPDAAEDNHFGRSNKTLASPSEFRLCLIDAFKVRGGSVEKIDPAGTSYTCHLCGSKEHLDHTTHYHTCSSCKQEWDREDNATANLLARWRERSSDDLSGGSARTDEKPNDNTEVQETRYERRKRARKEKEDRMIAARETNAKAAQLLLL